VALTIEALIHLRRARDLIDREFARPLDVPAMARAAHVSPAHFTRQYREAFGESPYQHLLTRRVERAKALLRAGELPVTEVCLAVGFTSLGSFSTRFHEIVGMTPSAYRASATAVPRVPACVARGLTRPPRHPASGRGSEKRTLLPDGSRTAQSRKP
jgi:AraC-like DNA-binding protein